MKSQWKVSSNCIDGKTMFIAYRKIDANAVDHSGNREYSGGYKDSREEAEAIATALNDKEKDTGL